MNIDELIKKGEELKTTFTDEKGLGLVFTTDITNLSKWVAKCSLFLQDKVGEDSKIYKTSYKYVGSIGSLTLDNFNELLGMLKAVKEMLDS